MSDSCFLLPASGSLLSIPRCVPYNLRMPSEENLTAQPPRGRLKVFLGYASGVGKSFQMFDEGRRRSARGQDVVVGAVQPQMSAECQRAAEALEVVPSLEISCMPVMNVAAILIRRPQICLVDGLAVDNPPGSRHPHRWQDVEELLAAGITVVGSVNLQYIDDQRDAVEKITGKHVVFTIPRTFLNTADEIVIVDAPTEGAAPSLSILREKALVLSADVLELGLQHYLHEHGIEPMWGTHERILVCLTPRTNAKRILSSARRVADYFHCEMLAVYVRQPGLEGEDRKKLEDNIARARAACARVDVLEGTDTAEAIAEYARTHGVTQIFVGQSLQQTWRSRLFGTPLNRLVRAARGMDVRVFPR